MSDDPMRESDLPVPSRLSAEDARFEPHPGEFLPREPMRRATGATPSEGNRLRLQVDGPSTFESWLDAILRAERFVHFENYILRDDRIGRTFRSVLVEKAREGVEVRVLYDWVGCWATRRSYWKPFRDAGVEVRAFNRPGIRDPFGVFQRDHRKLISVDGKIAYIGGLCVGEEWAGKDGDPPWRDAGVEIVGPAAQDATRAFERIWAEIGEPVPARLEPSVDPDEPDPGSSAVWLIEGEPGRSRVYRALQLVAAHARERIWITDPYFVAPRPVTQSLVAAAEAGVDVRILLPANNNWPWVGSLSRGGYRALLEGGVRIFEWQGPMIHAKTSVADGVWCRVGSTNLNAASLLGNWEIDVGVVDTDLARSMEAVFLEDLTSSIEIILPSRQAVDSARQRLAEAEAAAIRAAHLEPERNFPSRFQQLRGGRKAIGTASSRFARIVRAGSALSGAIAGHRPLGREDRTVLGTAAGFVLVVALFSFFFPEVVGISLAVVLGWLGTVAGVRAFVQAKRAHEEERAAAEDTPDPPQTQELEP